MKSEKIKVGIMGGTFDPIHIGHLILAQAAYEQLGLSKVLFIPAGRPPHKKDRKGASDQQRVDMVRLAIQNDERFSLSLIEMESEQYSYTYITLEKLHELNPDEEYYFITGQDSLETFKDWRRPEEIVRLAYIVSADRPDCDMSQMDALLQQNNEMFGDRFIGINCPDIQLSSHEIRNAVETGHSIRYMVPKAVYDYIVCNNIYKAGKI